MRGLNDSIRELVDGFIQKTRESEEVIPTPQHRFTKKNKMNSKKCFTLKNVSVQKNL